MKKVISIVVTFNRSNLLLHCIEALEQQTRKPDCILIIDNASTDNTYETVNMYNFSIPHIYKRLETNGGGAGGFYEGLKTAHELNEYDYFWVMDDDGEPHTNCLASLLDYSSEYDYMSPLVVDINDKETPAFQTLTESNITDIIKKYPNGIIQNHANPFNGILYSKEFLNKVGYPKKEMFIWGDENEYQARAISLGFTPVTIISALHYHPKDRLECYKDFMGRKNIIFVESQLRCYCKYRNFSYYLKTYKGYSNLLLYIFRYSYFFIISRRGDFKNLKLFYNAVSAALYNDFTGHIKFLK